MEKRLAYLAIILVFALGAFVGFRLRGPRPGNGGGDVKPDTVYIDKPVFVDKPVPVEVTPKGYELVPAGTIDRITQQIRSLQDSLDKKPKIVIRDSLIYIDVPIEQKHYGDSTYDAWVSGYQPTLDSLRFNQQTAIVEVPVYKTVTKQARWGVGIQAGVTYLPGQNGGVTPYVGLGISYNLLTF